MTTNELQEDFKQLVSILRRERSMRYRVFENNPEVQAQKVAEIQNALDLIVKWKDLLKPILTDSHEQLPLIEVQNPKRYT